MPNAASLARFPQAVAVLRRISHARFCSCFVCSLDETLPILKDALEQHEAQGNEIVDTRAALLAYENMTEDERNAEDEDARERGFSSFHEELGLSSIWSAA